MAFLRSLRESAKLEGSLAGLFETAADGSPLRVVVTEPLRDHAARLMETLGVQVAVGPHPTKSCSCRKASGRSMPTRCQLSEDVRNRMRQSYYERPDKSKYARRVS